MDSVIALILLVHRHMVVPGGADDFQGDGAVGKRMHAHAGDEQRLGRGSRPGVVVGKSDLDGVNAAGRVHVAGG